jgi:DNA repair exonuclease SbcCD ATPase subunit
MATKESELEKLLKVDTSKKEDGAVKITIPTEIVAHAVQATLVVAAPSKKEDGAAKITIPTEIVTQVVQAAPVAATTSEKDSLKSIIETQKHLSQVKASLGTIIDTLAQNPSMFTRLATSYGEMAAWQKIGLGLLLTAPTLAGAIVAHVGTLLVVSGVTGIAYTTAGIVLDDHHHCNVNIAERLKAGILSLAEVLELTIGVLDNIREKFVIEIEKFKTENIKLAQNVVELGEKLEKLGPQIELFRVVEKDLRASKNALEKTIEDLKQSGADQEKLIEQNQGLLDKMSKEHKKSQAQLTEKMLELTTVQAEMGYEVQRAKTVAAALQEAVTTLSGTVIKDKEQREAYQSKLDVFISKKEESFNEVADRVCKAEEELQIVKKELQGVKQELHASLDTHKALLSEQAKQINTHKTLLEEQARINALPAKKPVDADKLGIQVKPLVAEQSLLTEKPLVLEKPEKSGVLRVSGKENSEGEHNRYAFYSSFPKSVSGIGDKTTILPGHLGLIPV